MVFKSMTSISLKKLIFEYKNLKIPPDMLNGFHQEYFETLKSFSERSEYLGYPTVAKWLGEGFYRVVYDIGVGRVVKIASDDGLNQNFREVEVWECAKLKNTQVITPILSWDKKKYSWIIMKKADKVFEDPGEWMDSINQFAGTKEAKFTTREELHFFFLLISKINEEEIIEAINSSPFTKLEQLKSKVTHVDIADYAISKVWQILNEIYPNNINSWVKDVADIVSLCPLDPEDIHYQNWGMVDGKMALVDYGYDGAENENQFTKWKQGLLEFFLFGKRKFNISEFKLKTTPEEQEQYLKNNTTKLWSTLKKWTYMI